MATIKHLLFSVLPVAALMLAPTSARADDDDDMVEEQPPPQPAVLPVYTAPLAQTTQTTYVPQSVAMSGPEEISDFDFERPVPLGYTVVKRTRKGLLIGGAAAFGASYGISILTAAIGEDLSSGPSEVRAMWIPVAGPFLQITQTESATLGLFLAGLGAAQTTGAILLYYGLTTKKRVLVRNDIVGSMTFTPMAGDGTTGMMLSGRF